MEPFNPVIVKALFTQLVEAVGTQEAAAAYLGITRQRVSQLCSASWPDLPTFAQVATLETAVGQSIVFGALSRRVETDASRDAVATGVKACAAAATSLATFHAAQADGDIDAAEYKCSIADARKNLEAAQAHFDAVMATKPSLRAVA